MDCPTCKKGLIILELDQIEIDFCHSCGGIWLDEGELELLLAGTVERDSLLSSFEIDVTGEEKKVKCPLCRERMEKMFCGIDENKIRIDKCKKNEGYWFNKGELESIIKLASCGKESRILDLLKNTFSKRSQL